MTAKKQLFEQAQRLFIDGKLSESIKAFTKAIDAGEKSEIAFLSRGVAFLRNHEPEKAIHDFSEVVKMDDNNVRAHYYKGIAYLTKEDYRHAISELDRTIELKPQHGAAFFARGTAYAQMGNEKEATMNIKSALMSSEASVMEFGETIGLWRTQFDKTISIMSGEKIPAEMSLTEEEVNKVRAWLEQGFGSKRTH
jgi:tetratricopeptide (TPR) repeat protein